MPTKPLILRVLVYDLATDKQIRDITVNYTQDEKRLWLANLIVWASCNGKSVEILNQRDDEQQEHSVNGQMEI